MVVCVWNVGLFVGVEDVGGEVGGESFFYGY